jgi:hypothetical protein
MGSSRICSLLERLKLEDKIDESCSTHGRNKKLIIWLESISESDLLGDLSIDERLVLKRVFNKEIIKMSTGL